MKPNSKRRVRTGALSAVVLLTVVAVPMAVLPGWNPLYDKRVSRQLRRSIDTLAAAPVDGRPGSGVRTAYAARANRAVLVGPDGLTRTGRQVMQALDSARREGLDPDAYDVDVVRARLDDADDDSLTVEARAEALARAELALADGFDRFARNVALGGQRPSRAQPEWRIEDTDSVTDAVQRLLGGERAADIIASLRPTNRQYVALMGLLAELRSIEANGGWPRIADASSGDSAFISSLRARLMASADPDERENAARGAARYGHRDAALDSALASFQARHGLAATAKLDEATVDQLDVTVSDRIHQVALALERWRWLPGSLGDRAILVNVPEYVLRFYRDTTQTLEMNVIVGRTDWRTDLFASRMDRIVLNPYWNVPESILEEELIDDLRDDPASLSVRGFEVVDADGRVVDPAGFDWNGYSPESESGAFRLRQKPGGSNALGFVKFIMPNPYGVYLHDSPQESLFDRRVRALSHGCVRLARPLDLAEFVIENTGSGSAADVRTAMRTHETREIEMAADVEVYLAYFTVWIDAGGRARFLPDVYGYDATFRAGSGSPLARVAMARS